ncbi:hypothetical protein HK405_003406, partial [Cladochytrium tenue]
HVLVIPKAHCRDLLDIDQDLLAHLAVSIPRLARGIMKAVGSDSFNILQNNGATSGQVVFHLHFHILPRRPDDGIFPNNSSGASKGAGVNHSNGNSNNRLKLSVQHRAQLAAAISKELGWPGPRL